MNFIKIKGIFPFAPTIICNYTWMFPKTKIGFKAASIVLPTTKSEPITYLLILRFSAILEKNSLKLLLFVSFYNLIIFC